VKGGYTPDTVVVRPASRCGLQFYRDETADCSSASCSRTSGSSGAPGVSDHGVEFTPEERANSA